MVKRRKPIIENGYYDPIRIRPPQRYIYYDPDPSPAPFPWVILLLVFGVALWTNPGVVNTIIYWINPGLAEKATEQQKAFTEMVKYILLIVIVCAGIFVLFWWLGRKKKAVVVG